MPSDANCLSRAPAPPPSIRPASRADNGRRVDLSQRDPEFFSRIVGRRSRLSMGPERPPPPLTMLGSKPGLASASMLWRDCIVGVRRRGNENGRRPCGRGRTARSDGWADGSGRTAHHHEQHEQPTVSSKPGAGSRSRAAWLSLAACRGRAGIERSGAGWWVSAARTCRAAQERLGGARVHLATERE